jgi:hypothetical protein
MKIDLKRLALAGGLGFIFSTLIELIVNVIKFIRCKLKLKKIEKQKEELNARCTQTHKLAMEFVDDAMSNRLEQPRNPQAKKLYARLQEWQAEMYKVITTSDNNKEFLLYYRRWCDDEDLYQIINVDDCKE